MLTRRLKSVIYGGTLLIFITSTVMGHPGGTDSNGGHRCRKNCSKWNLSHGQYHHHPRSPKAPPRQPLGDSSPPRQGAEVPGQDEANKGSSQGLLGTLDQSLPVRFTGEISHVLDGDSFVIRRRGRPTRVHLVEVDTPELEQPYGQDANDLAETSLIGRSITLAVVDVDGAGDLWAQVYLSKERQLGSLLLQRGLAWRRPGRALAWKALEDQARQQGRGLWQASSPVAPWSWRHSTFSSHGRR